MKLRELVMAQEALQRFLALELPAATAFKIARTARPVEVELRNYERERVRLVMRLGEDDGRGQTVVSERSTEFVEEMNALLDVEVEVEIISLDPDILDGVNVKPADLMRLWFLFDDSV